MCQPLWSPLHMEYPPFLAGWNPNPIHIQPGSIIPGPHAPDAWLAGPGSSQVCRVAAFFPKPSCGYLRHYEGTFCLGVMLIFLTETLTSHFPRLNPFHAGDPELCTSLVGSMSTADQKEPGDSIDKTSRVTTICSCFCHPSPCRLDSLDTDVSPDWA